MEGRWRIELFGWLRGTLGETVVSRFRTHNAAVLLAYLALHKQRSHPRDELGAMLWPEADDPTCRARLRLALTSLRHQFEPPSLPKGSVFVTTGSHLQMDPRMVQTDVEEFEALISKAEKAPDEAAQRELLEAAVAGCRGEFLPGFYEDWILEERQRLNDLLEEALRQLADLCAEQGHYSRGLSYARRLAAMNPWEEERHLRIIQLCLQSGNTAAALRQNRELKTMLAELGEELSGKARQLSEKVENLARSARPAQEDSEWTSVESSPVNMDSKLPVRLTRFFGRAEENVYILNAFEAGARLITLTGAGGCGKTRLSIESGYMLHDRGWTAWFVPLADVGSPDRIYDAILTCLKVERSQDPLRHLDQFFGRFEKPLLILDNFEHLMDSGALFVKRLLEEVPNLRCLASSRQRLALEGEAEIAVSPLAAPPEAAITPEQAAAFPCVQLYVDRCQALRPDFQVTEKNVQAIATLCARLEGIPLAIEIASSLSQSLSPGQMIGQLEKRLDLLTSPRRDIVQRHKTLRNAVAYSYDLLTPLQAKLFASLSVFRGGWTIRSANEICFRPLLSAESAHEDCFSLLFQLRERSLIETYETASGEMRFRMLETFRDFGRDCLRNAEWDDLVERHDVYFLRMAEEAYQSLRTPKEQASMDGMDADYDNLMHVFERALERRDVEFGIRLAVGFSQMWRSRGAVVRERVIIRELVALAEVEPISPELMMKGLNALSHASYLFCDWETSLEAEQRTLSLALEHGNHEYAAISYGGISNAFMGLGRPQESKEMLYQALEHARLADVESRIPVILGNLGYAYWREGNPAEAEKRFREALALCEKLYQRPQANLHKLNIARVLLDQGHYAEAYEEMSGSIERSAKLHRAHDAVMALVLFAKYYRLTGDLGRSGALIQQAIEKALRLMNENSETYVAVEVAQLLAAQGEHREAATVLSALSKASLAVIDKNDTATALETCKAALGETEFNRCWARGISTPMPEILRAHTMALAV